MPNYYTYLIPVIVTLRFLSPISKYLVDNEKRHNIEILFNFKVDFQIE